MKNIYYKKALLHMIAYKLDNEAIEKLANHIYYDIFGASLDDRLEELVTNYADCGKVVTEIGTLNIYQDNLE